ncbi:MAG TPA: MoaD/ThiS family protein [Actinomycetota bacterium]
MSTTVRIPTPLRNMTAGASEVTIPGGTVRDLIDGLEHRYPGMRARLCEDSGQVRRFVNVFVGDEDIRFLQGLDTPVPDGTQVSIIPAVAGGGL